MSRRIVGILVCVCLLAATGFAGGPQAASADRDSSSASRDASSVDTKGIPKKHRYYWAVVGGAALGAGIGALLPPGSGKSATKGMLIGGSTASLLYLAGHRNEAGKWRPLAWIATNAVLAGGIGWTVCNCGGGFPVGALIGGGFTGAVQAFEPRHHQTLTKYTGADQNIPPPPPQNSPPQNQPPNQPQAAPPPQNPPPQEQLPDDLQTQARPPWQAADNLPDSPQPRLLQDPPQDQI